MVYVDKKFAYLGVRFTRQYQRATKIQMETVKKVVFSGHNRPKAREGESGANQKKTI